MAVFGSASVSYGQGGKHLRGLAFEDSRLNESSVFIFSLYDSLLTPDTSLSQELEIGISLLPSICLPLGLKLREEVSSSFPELLL